MKPTMNFEMLLLPAFNSMAAQVFVDPFRAANYLCGKSLYRWAFSSLDGESVRASNGMLIGDTKRYNQQPANHDFLVINASWAPEKFDHNHHLQKWLHQQARQGTTLVGIDTGAFVLAAAGLMKGYQATVHYEHSDAFQERFPETQLESVLFTMDRQRLSCCGGLAAFDLALEMICQHQGIDLGNAVAQYLFKDRLRPSDENQRHQQHEPVGYRIPEKLREAIILMERNLEEPLTLTEVSYYSGISQRQLERLFRTHTGVTPVRYYIRLRLNRARSLLTQTELSIAEIAGACGFNNAEQFSRSYKAHFQLPPSEDRRKGRIPFQFHSNPGYQML